MDKSFFESPKTERARNFLNMIFLSLHNISYQTLKF